MKGSDRSAGGPAESTAAIDVAAALRDVRALLLGVDQERDAELLLCHVCGWERSVIYAFPERKLAPGDWSRLQDLAVQRASGTPLAYLIGQREFWSLPIAVSADTLIPRADTEVLVETALQLPLAPSSRILDLGAGSGAIAIALAHERPQWQVHAVERCPRALAVARTNGQRLVPGRVQWLAGSWFEPVRGQTFSLIVSNPPYIDPRDAHLQRGDLRFEPQQALVACEDGLADLRQIIGSALQYLLPDGWLALEHGWDQHHAVRDLLKENGYLDVFVVHDYGGQPRVSGGRRAAE